MLICLDTWPKSENGARQLPKVLKGNFSSMDSIGTLSKKSRVPDLSKRFKIQIASIADYEQFVLKNMG